MRKAIKDHKVFKVFKVFKVSTVIREPKVKMVPTDVLGKTVLYNRPLKRSTTTVQTNTLSNIRSHCLELMPIRLIRIQNCLTPSLRQWCNCLTFRLTTFETCVQSHQQNRIPMCVDFFRVRACRAMFFTNLFLIAKHKRMRLKIKLNNPMGCFKTMTFL